MNTEKLAEHVAKSQISSACRSVQTNVNRINAMSTNDGKQSQYQALMATAKTPQQVAQVQAAGIATGTFDAFKNPETGERMSYAEMRSRYG